MDAVSGINSLMERAYQLFDAYRDRFDCPPVISHIRDIKQLPVLNVFEVLRQVDYSKVDLLKDVQRNTPRTFFNLYDNVFPGLITEDEYNVMKYALYAILKNAGITADDIILIVSDEDRSYLAMDFTNMLLEEKFNIFIAFATRVDNLGEIRNTIGKTGTTVVFDFTQAGIVRTLDKASLKKVVFINRVMPGLDPAVRSYSLYHVGKIGFIGITDLRQGRFFYPEKDFYIETDGNGYIMVTCLFRRLFPMIRYLTFDKGSFAGGRLRISSYMGVVDEHPVPV